MRLLGTSLRGMPCHTLLPNHAYSRIYLGIWSSKTFTDTMLAILTGTGLHGRLVLFLISIFYMDQNIY